MGGTHIILPFIKRKHKILWIGMGGGRGRLADCLTVVFYVAINFFFNFRNYTTTLKDAVPLITTYEGLKSQFDWLTDGGISRLVESNLGRQIKQLEMFLRYQSFLLKNFENHQYPYYSLLSHFFPSNIVFSHPGYRIRIPTFYPSRIPGSKRQRIPDPDPQH
jgi:hypothetical protein